jgi:hypothetical protein
MYNFDIQQSIPSIAAISDPGSFAFLDQLMVGQVPGVPHGPGDVGLTIDEAETHFGIWCMMASPLWITHDIFDPPPGIHAIVTNPEAIAINQDTLGRMAVRIDGSSNPRRAKPAAPRDVRSRRELAERRAPRAAALQRGLGSTSVQPCFCSTACRRT